MCRFSSSWCCREKRHQFSACVPVAAGLSFGCLFLRNSALSLFCCFFVLHFTSGAVEDEPPVQQCDAASLVFVCCEEKVKRDEDRSQNFNVNLFSYVTQ